MRSGASEVNLCGQRRKGMQCKNYMFELDLQKRFSLLKLQPSMVDLLPSLQKEIKRDIHLEIASHRALWLLVLFGWVKFIEYDLQAQKGPHPDV